MYKLKLITPQSNSPSLEKTSTSHKLKLPSAPTSWIVTNWPIRGRAQVNDLVVPSSSWPGYQAHSGFLCRSLLLLPTRISRSCNGLWPQQPRVVMRTTRTVCAASRSTRHHGDASFCVSEHSWPSGTWLPGLPSLASEAGPARVADDWLTGFRYATLVPVNREKKMSKQCD